MRSPRHPSTVLTRLFPECPLQRPVCSPDLVWEQPAPPPRPGGSMSPVTDVASAWNFFPQRRKFIFLKWDETMLAEPLRFQSLLPYSWFCFWRIMEKRQLSESHALPGPPTTLVLSGAPSSAGTPRPAVPRQRQSEAEAGTHAQIPRTPRTGDQGQNKCTGEVERLEDNPGGFHVVIYNRDCKMVNQIWS